MIEMINGEPRNMRNSDGSFDRNYARVWFDISDDVTSYTWVPILADKDETYEDTLQLHRRGGPAVIHSDGTKEWWLHGIPMVDEEHHKKVLNRKIPVDEMKIIYNLSRRLEKFAIKDVFNIFAFEVLNEFKFDNFTGKVDFYNITDLCMYFQDGMLHREDGPAVENLFEKAWFLNGKFQGKMDI